jgi:hypothetical protein
MPKRFRGSADGSCARPEWAAVALAEQRTAELRADRESGIAASPTGGGLMECS